MSISVRHRRRWQVSQLLPHADHAVGAVLADGLDTAQVEHLVEVLLAAATAGEHVALGVDQQ